jgi:glucose uptake protein
MICWGFWANSIELTPGWPIQLFYWDYVAGILLASLAWGLPWAFTLGGGAGVLFPAVAGADNRHLLLAVAGGVIFNAANRATHPEKHEYNSVDGLLHCDGRIQERG